MTLKNTSPDLQERLKLAKEAANKAKQVLREKELAYYESLVTGPVWKWFKIGMYYCLGLAALITIETLIPGKTTKVNLENTYWDEGRINVENEWYLPETTYLTGYLDTSFFLMQTPIFGAQKYLAWTVAYQDTKTPLTYYYYKAHKYNSIYDYFIYIQIVLLIPLLVFLLKRPSPLFKFARMLCLFLIFPASIYLLFVTFGIVNLLPFGV